MNLIFCYKWIEPDVTEETEKLTRKKSKKKKKKSEAGDDTENNGDGENGLNDISETPNDDDVFENKEEEEGRNQT